MRLLKVATLATAAALMLVLVANEAQAAKKQKPITGTVVEVKKDDDKDTGTVKVKVTPKKKKGDTTAPEPVEMTIKLTDTTKFQTVTGKKGNETTVDAKFSDVSEGKILVVTTNDAGDTAVSVQIKPAPKKK
jgi:hypothetical protein